MELTPLENIDNAEQARYEAMNWQSWQADQELGYGDLIEYQTYFEQLAERFNLKSEFKENGII